jgi:DNA repair protein SbcD/Mre11
VVRILHTSDWHLGRQFQGLPLYDDHEAVLEQVLAAVEAHRPDALIIAGDLFDRASPPNWAVRQFNGFISRCRGMSSTAIVIIAGNHDSADRIGSMGVFAAAAGNVLVRGPLDAAERPLVLHDAAGPIAFSALPFSYEYAARECFGREDINCPADVLAAQLAAARAHVPEGARWVVVAHAFVEGAQNSESERPLGRAVGGIETIPSSMFEGAHYVALGHLHRPQTAGAEHIRYAGAPLVFGFDEVGHDKSMSLVDLHGDGSVSFELIPFVPRRQVRQLKGLLSELIAVPEPCLDIVKVVLTDPQPLIEPMKRVREVYPNAVQLSYEWDTPAAVLNVSEAAPQLQSPTEVVASFLEQVRGDPISETEADLVAARLQGLAVEAEEA